MNNTHTLNDPLLTAPPESIAHRITVGQPEQEKKVIFFASEAHALTYLTLRDIVRLLCASQSTKAHITDRTSNLWHTLVFQNPHNQAALVLAYLKTAYYDNSLWQSLLSSSTKTDLHFIGIDTPTDLKQHQTPPTPERPHQTCYIGTMMDRPDEKYFSGYNAQQELVTFRITSAGNETKSTRFMKNLCKLANFIAENQDSDPRHWLYSRQPIDSANHSPEYICPDQGIYRFHEDQAVLHHIDTILLKNLIDYELGHTRLQLGRKRFLTYQDTHLFFHFSENNEIKLPRADRSLQIRKLDEHPYPYVKSGFDLCHCIHTSQATNLNWGTYNTYFISPKRLQQRQPPKRCMTPLLLCLPRRDQRCGLVLSILFLVSGAVFSYSVLTGENKAMTVSSSIVGGLLALLFLTVALKARVAHQQASRRLAHLDRLTLRSDLFRLAPTDEKNRPDSDSTPRHR